MQKRIPYMVCAFYVNCLFFMQAFEVFQTQVEESQGLKRMR